MTQLASKSVIADDPALVSPAASGTASRLLRFALASLARRPERAVFAVAGIGLAIASVVVVRTIAVGYQVSGVSAVTAATGGAPFWLVPAGGVRLDERVGALVPSGRLPAVRVPAGWTGTVTLTGPLPGHPGVLLTGRGRGPAGQGTATALALLRLRLAGGGTLVAGHVPVRLRLRAGSGAQVIVPLAVARAAGLRSGWATLAPPAGQTGTAAQVSAATGLRVTADPARQPTPGSRGLIYQAGGAAGRDGFLSFSQKYAAVLGARVGSSGLGLVADVALGLGFVIAVTSFAAAVTERRREFGIMASIGLSDEVLYFFLAEAAAVFVAAYLLGVGAGGAVVALVLPSFFTLSAWLQASALVAMYLPALAIVAALVPVHRLLQQRPVRLLADQP